MKDLVAGFTRQLTEAILIGEKATLSGQDLNIRNIVITGLGGSGIGGTIVSEIISKECTVPVYVNKDYFLPAFVNEQTLVIVSSYSGNTEETLAAMEAAINKNAKIVCVSSGGKVLEIAKSKNIDHIVIPGGLPPRACLAYSFTQLFFILNAFHFISSEFKQELKSSIALLDAEEKSIHELAKSSSKVLHGKIPVLYAVAGNEGLAVRFRQQLNENSKMLAWQHVIPEMNHNELVGWRSKSNGLAVVFIRNVDDYERSTARIEINKKIIKEYCETVIELFSKGESRLQRSLYLIHLFDWISVELAVLKGIDATEVKVIDFLKSELSNI